jgi:hypothetical protein
VSRQWGSRQEEVGGAPPVNRSGRGDLRQPESAMGTVGKRENREREGKKMRNKEREGIDQRVLHLRKLPKQCQFIA